MSQRQPDRRRQTSGGSPRRGGAARAVSTTRELLANIARVIMLAIMAGRDPAGRRHPRRVFMRPAALGSWPTANSYVAFVPGRGVDRPHARHGAERVVSARPPLRRESPGAAVRRSCGRRGRRPSSSGWSGRSGSAPTSPSSSCRRRWPFVLMGLVSPGLFRRPGRTPRAGSAAAGDEGVRGRRPASPERARQRRGGRARR